MPIYEYYCPDNHRIYQFYAKTLAQGRTVPPCPDGAKLRMKKLVSTFAVVGKKKEEKAARSSLPGGSLDGASAPEDSRLDQAMEAMEGEMAGMDENDPRAMGRMMRRMAELSGEKIDGEMEEVVRKLEEGADPDSLEDQMSGPEGGEEDPEGSGPPEAGPPGAAETHPRFRRRRGPPVRDPRLYDYPPN